MEGEIITMQEIFRFRQTGINAEGVVQGKFEATGIRPRFLDQVCRTASPFRPTSSGLTRSSKHEPRLDPRAVLVCVFGAVVLAAETCSAGSRATAPRARQSTGG